MGDVSVPAIGRMHAILSYLLENPGSFTLTELCDSLELSKASAFRMLSHLAELGYLECDLKSSRYSLGPLLIALGYRARQQIDIRQVSHQAMRSLSEELRETVKLSIFRDGLIYVVDTCQSPRVMRITVDAGSFFPPHVGAAGKLLLAFQPEEVIDAYLATDLRAFTRYTLTEPEALREQLEAIRAEGISFDRQEETIGIEAIASPVFDESGSIVSAVSVPYLANSLEQSQIESIQTRLIEHTQAISKTLGYRRIQI